MTATGKKTLRALRALMLTTASVLAATPALADKGPLKLTVLPPAAPAQGGNLRPLYGNLSAFYGNLSGFYGNLSAFDGTITPYYGNLSAFYGNLSAFSGGVDPFWGNLSAFQTSNGAQNGYLTGAYGNLSAFYGNLSAFSGDLSAKWGNLSAFWGNLSAFNASNAGDYASLSQQLSGMVSSSAAFWGPAVTAKTGKSFNDGFAAPTLAKFGIDLNDPSTLSNLTPVQRSQFIMAWYDGLIEFAGVDHVDHWMREVNWTPALTQIQGAGSGTVVGLLDFTVKDMGLQQNITKASGISTFSTGHGAAVASLIVAAHDGSGVMGIAPSASVVAYNPFDATATAGWSDVTNGAIMLGRNNASLINASLGASGYTLAPDWNTVLKNGDVRNAVKNSIFIIAAGNDGITQTQNIAWDKANAPILVVGSVDPNLNISSFSNRPGTACLTDDKGKCGGDYLMNHFITASGEWILVSDDNGGFTRMSGTSFAAPLVSGAIALLNDRWPWLAQHPKDTSNIILKSARDLGAPGPDPVYGVGLLDVQASQSPLSYDSLQWWSPKSTITSTSLTGLVSNVTTGLVSTTAAALRDPKQQATWQANGVFVYGYEQLTESYRDFAIPLSSKLVGQTVTAANGQQEQLQSYLTNSFTTWATTPVAAASDTKSKAPKLAFLDFRGEAEVPLATTGGLRLSLAATPMVQQTGWRASSSPVAARFALSTEDGATGVKLGFGEGASALGGVSGLSLHSDYDPAHGGANPLLGFASGGAYGGADIALTKTLRLSAGVTARDSRRDLDTMSGADRLAAIAVGDYKAQAGRVGMTWRASDRVQLSGGYTHLSEANGLLGVQSTDPADLGRGTQTDGIDAGADIRLADGLTLSGTASMGHVRPQAAGSQNLTAGAGGITTSAFEVALSKERLFGPDRVRLSFSQPMHTESGKLAYTGLQVVDRQTGELGLVTQSFDAQQDVRPFAAELLYGRQVLGGAGEFGLFTRAETRGVDLQGHTTPVVMTGARFRLSY